MLSHVSTPSGATCKSVQVEATFTDMKTSQEVEPGTLEYRVFGSRPGGDTCFFTSMKVISS